MKTEANMLWFIFYFSCIALVNGQRLFESYYIPGVNVRQRVPYRTDHVPSEYYGVAVPWNVHPSLLDHTKWPLPIAPRRTPLPWHKPKEENQLRKCKINDPNLEQCIISKIEATRVRPSPRDPFFVKALYAATVMNSAKVHISVTNLIARGGSNYKIEKLKVNFHNGYKFTGGLTLSYPQLNITTRYYQRGTTMSYGSFQTNGILNAFLRNVKAVFSCDGTPVIRNGAEYLQLDSVTASVTIGQADLYLKPYDSSELGHRIAEFAMSDPNGAIQKVTPAINEAVSRIFKQYMDKVLVTMPLRDVLVD